MITNFYNTKNSLINTSIGKEYGGVSAWQGIRYLGSDTYLITGTTNPNPNTGNGLIYVGNINCENGIYYNLVVPNTLGTSIYGPDYDINTGKYTFVGSCINFSLKTLGFIYTGTLDNENLKNVNNFSYPSVNNNYDINFLHSNINGLIVGNSGNKNNDEIISYIYDINNLSTIKKEIKFPKSKTTTTYGIWYNGNFLYTLVGGYSNKKININDIYLPNGIIRPIGNAFIVDYNEKTNQFSNWKSISYDKNGILLETHFQGIFGNSDGTYQLNANVLNIVDNLIPQGYFLNISRNYLNEFVYDIDNWIQLNYDKFGITSSNSVANNTVVGLFVGNENISYQCEIFNEINTSKFNQFIDNVKNNEKIQFNNTFIDNNLITYKQGTFTFLEYGTYFINFNIYIENTTLPSIIFEVSYTINGKQNSFNVAQKGIDEIGTQTAHSLVIPCSFINKFNIGDKIEIINRSGGQVTLISNYVQNSVNAIVTITKLN